MASKFPPVRDSELVAMATAASAKITATPAVFGLSVGQASSLAGLVTSYTDAYNVAIDPATRTKAKIAAKNAAKAALAANLRDLNRFVQATKTVTDEQKIEIGFPVYASRTPINPPTTAPNVKQIVTQGRISRVTVRDVDGERRGRPAGVASLVVVSYVGAAPAPDARSWNLEGIVTRNQFDITWPPSLPAGTQCWVACAWVSPRGAAGPLSTPISVSIGGGLSVMPEMTMKMAA